MTSVYHLLGKYNIRPKKRLGQNFLADPNHLQKIVKAADLSAGDTVFEVGPGMGALTAYLCAAAKGVVAIEIDPAMVDILLAEVGADNLRVARGDALTVDPADTLAANLAYFSPGDDYIVVANLPYYITSAIIRHLLEALHPPRRTVITIQKEVAHRITAGPGRMNLLAVSVQFYGRPRLCHTIPANAFVPPPNVDSAVLRIDRHPAPPVSVEDPAGYFRVVKAGFSQKRKQLKNALAGGLHLAQADAARLLELAGVDPRRRAETLSLGEWAALARALAGFEPGSR